MAGDPGKGPEHAAGGRERDLTFRLISHEVQRPQARQKRPGLTQETGLASAGLTEDEHRGGTPLLGSGPRGASDDGSLLPAADERPMPAAYTALDLTPDVPGRSGG